MDDGGDAGLGRDLHRIGNGKNASLAITAPLARSPAFRAARNEESTLDIWPAPIPTVAPSRGEHDRVGLDAGGDRPGEQQVGPLPFARLPRRDDLHVLPGLLDRVGVLDEGASVDRPHVLEAAEGSGARTTRRFARPANVASASGVNDGATTTSVKTSAIASAASASTSPLNATIPPNADTVSLANALA